MSTQTKTKPKKGKSANLYRAGVSFQRRTYDRGVALAKKDNRPFANFLGALIEREWERQEKEQAA